MNRFRIVLEPLARPGDPQGFRRLRAAMKAMLRGYGLKVIEAREITDAERENDSADKGPTPAVVPPGDRDASEDRPRNPAPAQSRAARGERRALRQAANP